MRTWTSRLVIASAVIALAAAFSCKTFDLPIETCNPSGLHTEPVMGGSNDAVCNRCLEDSCCDKVGVCANKNGCAEIVSGVHRCVLREGLRGARRETACAEEQKLAELSEANDAYRCMRDRCGNACGLPVCRVDQGALLIQSADCDGCFASSCCPQLNACYESRACKLTVECIVRECGADLGTSLVNAALSASPDAAALPVEMCPDGGAPPSSPSGFGAPECVRKCLCQFKDNDQGLPPETLEKRPIVLALRVYECGVRAGCASSCSLDAGRADAH